MARRGADAVIEALDRFGVEYVFGHPGGAAMPIFDALLNSKQIKFVLTRHEQGATHMADGYARATWTLPSLLRSNTRRWSQWSPSRWARPRWTLSCPR